MSRKNYNGWEFLDDNMAWFALIAMFVCMAISSTCNGQDPANWRRLYSPDMVCMPLEDFHTVAAKRAVADQLSRERAWILIQQKGAIENLQRQVKICEEDVKDLMGLLDEQEGRIGELQDANIEIQTKLAKARQWSVIGKAGVALVGIVTIGTVVNQFAP